MHAYTHTETQRDTKRKRERESEKPRIFQVSYLSLLNLSEWRMAGLFCLRFQRCTLSSARALTSAPCGRNGEDSIYTQVSISPQCTHKLAMTFLHLLVKEAEFQADVEMAPTGSAAAAESQRDANTHTGTQAHTHTHL